MAIIVSPDVPAAVEAAFHNAVAASRFPLDRAGLNLQLIYSPEPPTGELIGWNVPAYQPSEGRRAFLTLRSADALVFREAVLHALGHVFFAAYMGDPGPRAAISGWFADPDGRRGTLADWTAASWQASTGEAIAEFFKDVYLPTRRANNLTTWEMRREAFAEFTAAVEAVICPPGDV